MKKNTILNKMFFSLVGLAFVLFIFVQSLNSATYDLSYYSKYSEKNNIAEYVGVEQKQVVKMYKSMQDQIKSGDTQYLKPYFNEREISHMEDVHNLFNLANIIKYISLFIILMFLLYFIFSSNNINKVNNIKIVRKSIFIIMILLVILTIIISIDFSSAFIKFHKIFFNNDLWILDPKTDLMIRMLPENYFLSISLRIFLTFISGVILSIILLSLNTRYSKEN